MIELITTGGTIAEVADGHGEQHVAGSGLLSSAGYSGPTRTTDLFHLPSTSIGPAEMMRITGAVQRACDYDDTTAVVVTHGTATLEETAFFTSLVVLSRKPVVFTGAILPPGQYGHDGPRNLRDAFTVANSPSSCGRGILVVMNGDIHDPTDVSKLHCTSVAGFRSPEFGVLGRVEGQNVYFVRETRPRKTALRADLPLPWVEILDCYSGMRQEVFSAIVAAGVKGLVLATMGPGVVPRQILACIAAASADKTTVVASSRCLEGRIVTPAEGSDISRFGRDLVSAGAHLTDLSPVKARIKLMLALGVGQSGTDIARSMLHRVEG